MTSRHSRRHRGAVLTAAATVTAALVLAGCGGASTPSAHSGHGTTAMASSGSSATAAARQGGHNAQDVTFAQGMIPHHRQAVAMADLAVSRAGSQEVKDLAARIRKAQDPEIATMSGWLKTWGETVPGASASAMPSMSDMPGMDHSGGSMPGMDHSGGSMPGMDHSGGSMPGMDHSGESMPGMDHTGGSMPGMMSDADMRRLEKLSGAAFDTAFLQMMIRHHEGAVAMARTEQAKGAYGPARNLAKSIVATQSAEITEMRKLLGKH
ncbi:DUF305 domain-containing protein [Streptomyces echinoruber]|uniref:Lipoprotein n=1 Tax=Streptomyces echinoruber TaxID=68898 RepID=A0A918VF05_9ACTN|nr:DUF305 domain-containing protein [Streptomyces echinoruber]GGZ91750.1 lipoprotein [Streptomyces echinoruber]